MEILPEHVVETTPFIIEHIEAFITVFTLFFGAIVGGITLWAKHKFTLLQSNIDSYKAYESQDHEKVSKALETIWGAFTDYENQVRHGRAAAMQAGENPRDALTPIFQLINEQSVYLPDDLFEAIKEALDVMQSAWLRTESVEKRVQDKIVEAGLLETALDRIEMSEETLGELNDRYAVHAQEHSEQMAALRSKFRSYLGRHAERPPK